MIIEIVLPAVDMDLSPNRKNGKSYHSTNKKKNIDKNVGQLAGLPYVGILKPKTSYAIEITFFLATKRRVDIDNLLSASKARMDGIANVLCIDDSQFNPILLKREYRKGNAGMTLKILDSK
jgi:Holliday junction resolvase RusA-like endonuclease